VPFREVPYRGGRNEQGRLGYQLWPIKPDHVGSIPMTPTTPTIGCGISISPPTRAAVILWIKKLAAVGSGAT
jgi:hypothetical protein